MSSCTNCSNLDLSTLLKAKTTGFHSLQKELKKQTLSSLRLSSKTCPLCTLLLQIVNFHSSKIPPGTPPDEVYCFLSLCGYGDILSLKSGEEIAPGTRLGYSSSNVCQIPRLCVHLQIGDRDRRIVLPCGLQLKASESETSGTTSESEELLRGRLVTAQIDLSLLKKWIKMCAEDHGDICTPARITDEEDHFNIRVIDVEQLCIVELPKGAEYVALSYVWGKCPQQRLLLENYEFFTKPFGLRMVVGTLPKTIRDTLDLVRQLGQRLVWVDALCIIQDDPLDLEIQIKHMNVVYGCASLTVVAASGSDSNAGLPGLDPSSRESLLIDQEIRGAQLITSLPDFGSSLVDSLWESRGWTMQEKVLSKHLLIFTRYQVFYHCNSATWCEDAIWESRDARTQLGPAVDASSPDKQACALPHRSVSGLRKYSHFVKDYRSRQLSFEGDALNAFMGALTALGKDMNTSFIWGLPESAFDETLLWLSRIQKPSFRRDQFPSWTWLGWKDSELPGLTEFVTVVFAEDHVETIRHVQWHKITPEGDQQLIGPPPTNYYILPEFDISTIPKARVQNLLRFWARSAHLSVAREPKVEDERRPSFSRYGCPDYSIEFKMEDGQMAHLASISLSEEWRRGQLDMLEFILICERRMRDRWDSSKIVEELDLMLVETTEGVSYRVQLTHHRIDKVWWEYFQPVWRVVTLG